MAGKRKGFFIFRLLWGLIKLSAFILIVLVITYFVSKYVTQRTVVHNVSMEATFYEGDNVLMDKITYRLKRPERFDIICFKKADEKENYIKRVIGLPGETVHILDGHIFINDKEIDDYEGLPPIEGSGRAYEPIKLDNDEYFVVGDNREESIDSRSVIIGNVKEDEILGRAWFRIYPFERMGLVK